MVFVFSGDILKLLSLSHLVTLFAASFNQVSALIDAIGYYHRIVRVSQYRTCLLNSFDHINHCDQKQGNTQDRAW
jgi:hypothetical protein